MRNISDKVVEKIKTHVLYSILFLRDNVEKCGKAGQDSDDNMAHAHFILDTYGYRCTITICNTYCFPTATMLTLMRLDVT
jgi:hypothetical protein